MVKFLRKEYPHPDGKLILDNKRLLSPSPRISSTKYSYYFLELQHKKNYPWIPVVTHETRLYILYHFIQATKKRFQEKLFDRVYNGVMPPVGKSAASMVRIFLDEYEIEPSEYDPETGYKAWQRSRQYTNWKTYERDHQTNQWKR